VLTGIEAKRTAAGTSNANSIIVRHPAISKQLMPKFTQLNYHTNHKESNNNTKKQRKILNHARR